MDIQQASPSITTSSLSNKAPKKIFLPGFKVRESLCEEDAAKHLHSLSLACKRIFSSETPSSPYEELYKTVELLCRYGHAKAVHTQLYNECLAWSRTGLLEAFGRVSALPDMARLWTDYVQLSRLLADIYAIQDRVYSKNTGMIRISAFMPSMFKNAVWNSGKDKILQMIMCTLDEVRTLFTDENAEMLRDAFGMLTSLEVFVGDVKGLFVERSVKCYTIWFQNKARELTSPQFIEAVRERIDFEDQLVKYIFPEHSQSELIEGVRRALIGDRLGHYGGAVLRDLVEAGDTVQLGTLYTLVALSDSLPILCIAFGGIVKEAAGRILGTPNVEQLINSIIEYKMRMDMLVQEAFNNDPHYVSAVKDALESVLNHRSALVIDCLICHFDNLLNGCIPVDAEQLDMAVERGIGLFRLCHAKDVFEAKYKEALGRRLLGKRTIGIQHEETIINRLKGECGTAYVSRMEGMFRDMTFSRDLSSAFQKSSLYREKPDSTAFTVSIVTNGIWPPGLESSDSAYIPASVQEMERIFETFYKKSFPRRRLTWQHGPGECVIRAHFSQGPVDLHIPCSFASLLLHTTGERSIEVSDLFKLSGLSDVLFNRALGGLVKAKILIKEGGKVLFNKSAQLADKVRLYDTVEPTLHKELAAEDTRASDNELAAEGYRLDAAIVRYLKKHTRATLDGLCKQIKSTGTKIKERLEGLIEKDYVKREGADFVYVP